MADDKTVRLKAGDRLRMHGATYQATAATDLPADMVPVTPQATRLRKVLCETCGYTARITQRWISKGLPDCPNTECPDKGKTMIEAVKTAKAETVTPEAEDMPDMPDSPDSPETETETETDSLNAWDTIKANAVKSGSVLARMLADMPEAE